MSPTIDAPDVNDNRNYRYTGTASVIRPDHELMMEFIPNGSRVLDLGCGDGSLLALLRDTKGVVGKGIDRSPTGIEQARKKHLDVTEGEIDRPLTQFADDEFDVAVCSATIHMVMYPEALLREMKRLAPVQIVSFPNFAFWRNRLELLVKGRMPRHMLFGYSWFSTGHIHQLSLRDFENVVEDVVGLAIQERKILRTHNPLKNGLISLFPNLFGLVAAYKLTRTPPVGV